MSWAACPHLIKDADPVHKGENDDDRRHIFWTQSSGEKWSPQCKRVEGKKEVSSVKVGVKRGAYGTKIREYAHNFEFCKSLNIKEFTPQRLWNLSRSLDTSFLLSAYKQAIRTWHTVSFCIDCKGKMRKISTCLCWSLIRVGASNVLCCFCLCDTRCPKCDCSYCSIKLLFWEYHGLPNKTDVIPIFVRFIWIVYFNNLYINIF